jgi:hypothetical protein
VKHRSLARAEPTRSARGENTNVGPGLLGVREPCRRVGNPEITEHRQVDRGEGEAQDPPVEPVRRLPEQFLESRFVVVELAQVESGAERVTGGRHDHHPHRVVVRKHVQRVTDGIAQLHRQRVLLVGSVEDQAHDPFVHFRHHQAVSHRLLRTLDSTRPSLQDLGRQPLGGPPGWAARASQRWHMPSAEQGRTGYVRNRCPLRALELRRDGRISRTLRDVGPLAASAKIVAGVAEASLGEGLGKGAR